MVLIQAPHRRKLIIGLLLLVIIGYILYSYILYNRPKFELRNIDIIKYDSKVHILITGYNNTKLNEIPCNLISPNNSSYSFTAKAIKINGSLYWQADVPLTMEGVYKIEVVNPLTNKIIKEKNFEFYDSPSIKVNLDLNGNMLVVNVTTRDLTGIEKVLLETYGRNFTLKPLDIDSKGNGLYSLSLKINSTEDIDYRIIAIDKTDKHVTGIEAGTYNLTRKDRFIIHCINNGLRQDQAEELYSYGFVRDLYPDSVFNKLLECIKSNNITMIVIDQIARDNRTWYKRTTLKKALEVIEKLDNTENINVARLIGNVSNNGYYSIDGLIKAVKFIEKNDLDWNFSRPICFSALADACYFLPEITEYPLETYYLVLQVGDTFYFYKIIETNNKTNIAYVWREAILPYAEWRLNRIKNGTFTPIDTRIVNGDLALLAKWVDKKVVEAACRSLYPYDALMDIDLSGKDDDRAFHNGRFKKALQYIINNFKNGHYQKIYQLLMKSKKEKDLLYKIAIQAPIRPDDVWINSGKYWREQKPGLQQKDEDALL